MNGWLWWLMRLLLGGIKGEQAEALYPDPAHPPVPNATRRPYWRCTPKPIAVPGVDDLDGR